jgi:hypothetical protein
MRWVRLLRNFPTEESSALRGRPQYLVPVTGSNAFKKVRISGTTKSGASRRARDRAYGISRAGWTMNRARCAIIAYYAIVANAIIASTLSLRLACNTIAAGCLCEPAKVLANSLPRFVVEANPMTVSCPRERLISNGRSKLWAASARITDDAP